MGSLQKTLVVLKPDTIGRSLIGEILSRFERAGFRIVGIKMIKPNSEFFFHHYETISKMISRRGQQVFDNNLAFMTQLPVVAIVLEGVEAVEYVRKMVGSTEPKSAAPGTIRGDYSHMSLKHAQEQNIGVPNLIHASGSLEEAELEIKHWFKKEELFDYEVLHQSFTR